MAYRHILVQSAMVTTVALNRPAVRNAMDDATLKELVQAFKAIAKDKNARAVIVRAEGPDFCSGADIEWMRRAGRLPATEAAKDAKLLLEMGLAVDSCPVPVIARVHGGVYGGGLGLAAACDMVVAEEGARMCFSECRLGIIPAVISCFVIPKIGVAQARRYYSTAEVFDMRTAKDLGLVHEVAAESELDSRVDALVQRVIRNGPAAVREAKALLRRFPELDFKKRADVVIKTLVKLRASPEGQEGLSAFLEKRPPEWTAGLK